MRIQITLTVAEGKRIIAKGIAGLPVVKAALETGNIFLKGGTTVSAVCEELAGKPMNILGRVSPRGTVTAGSNPGKFHCALIEMGKVVDADQTLDATVQQLGPDDVVIIGANAIDSHGNAAMMYGAPLGGPPGRIISGLMSECRHVIIAAGLEKLVPGSLLDIIQKTSRQSVDLSMGMAVGLTPVVGRIVTEVESISALADVDCFVIGKGGISGGEGSTTLVIDGRRTHVTRINRLIESIKGSTVSGIPETLVDCEAPCPSCANHLACTYKKAPKNDKGGGHGRRQGIRSSD
jgi:hypothetical protein